MDLYWVIYNIFMTYKKQFFIIFNIYIYSPPQLLGVFLTNINNRITRLECETQRIKDNNDINLIHEIRRLDTEFVQLQRKFDDMIQCGMKTSEDLSSLRNDINELNKQFNINNKEYQVKVLSQNQMIERVSDDNKTTVEKLQKIIDFQKTQIEQLRENIKV